MGFRAPKVRWEQEIDNILNIYDLVYDLPGVNSFTAIAHAIQKDAIQNSIDAEDIGNSDKWSVTFDGHESENGDGFIAITDTGTFGLTGKADIEDEELLDLDYKEYLQERWARFESLGYANPDIMAIGARGQGKFIFIGTSNDKEMIYETLRKDGVHRVGHWITKGTGGKPLIDSLEGNEATEYLKKRIPSLNPLKKIGTRVIIVNPKEELFKSFIPIKATDKKCDLAKYISETWWELLFDTDKKIFISLKMPGWSTAEKINVSPPLSYQKFKENPNNFKRWVIENKKIRDKIKVKELVIAYSDEEIPPELRGISIQRGKMKVDAFDIREGNDHIEEKYKKHIFGWIILNEEGEKELKKTEHPHHYGFKKTRGSLAQEIFGPRGWLSKEIKKFAEEELGIIPGEKKKIDLGKTHSRILDILNKLMRSLGYKSNVKSGTDRDVGGTRGENKPIRIQMSPLEYPGPTRRIELGEKVSGIKSKIINDTEKNISIKFEISLEGSSKAKKIEKVILNKNLKISSKSTSRSFGPYSITFGKNEFSPGKYTLKAELISLDDENKGEIYHKITKAIYLGIDPKAIGMFKKFDEREFPENEKKLKYKVDEEDDAFVIFVNVAHPCWKKAEKLSEYLKKNNEKDLGDPYDEYYLEIGLSAAIDEDLNQKGNFIEKDERENFQRILKRDDDDILGKSLKYRKKIMEEQLFNFLQ